MIGPLWLLSKLYKKYGISRNEIIGAEKSVVKKR